MSFRRDDAALALQPFGSLLSLSYKDLAADEREVRHPRMTPDRNDPQCRSGPCDAAASG